jgi:signal transduction histidine kinase
MLSHELRGPLGAIAVGLQLLHFPDTESDQRVKGSLERQTQQLVGLVEDLLDISRITHHKIRLRSEIVDLRAIAEIAAESTAHLMAQRKHAFTLAHTEMPVSVLGDPVRLQQVFANLLNNAAKYTPDGGRIELAVSRVRQEAVICVRDNGVGIPADMQEGIFELFGQADRRMLRAPQGLGIGLSLVKMIVQLHGGDVTVKSDGSGKGSEFTVRLPVVQWSEDHEGLVDAVHVAAGCGPGRTDRRCPPDQILRSE